MSVDEGSRFSLRKQVPKDRKVERLLPPFDQNATPYKQCSFLPSTVEAAQRSKSLMAMKIAKMIVVGDCGVGKTTLVNKFCHDVFDANYKATIGVDFEVERFDILDVAFSLQIWDTAGQERFRCIAKAYYRHATVIALVFDLTDEGTLSGIESWLRDALEMNNSNPLLFLIGTKKDLLDQDQLQDMIAKARKVANKINAEFWAVSSKDGDGLVHEAFTRIASLTFEKTMQDTISRQNEAKQVAIGQAENLNLAKAGVADEKRAHHCMGTKCQF